MSGWKRLTNGERDELCALPVWTTAEDRRRALSYMDKTLSGVREAVKAVSSGAPAPTNLGVLVAVARYEDAGWMPDGCFERWRRQVLYATECLEAPALVEWLGVVEVNKEQQRLLFEEDMTHACLQEEERLATAVAQVKQVRQRQYTHYQKLILARLSVGDTTGAQEIVRRVPTGPTRDAIDKILRESPLSSAGSGALQAAGTPSEDGSVSSNTGLLHKGADAPQPLHADREARTEHARLGARQTSKELSFPARMYANLRQHTKTVNFYYNPAQPTDPPPIDNPPPPDLLMSKVDAGELAERRQLDILRKTQLEELATRCQNDPCAEEKMALSWLRQRMETRQIMEPRADLHELDGLDHEEARRWVPVLITLATRLLENSP